jgi:hypothetical protein
MASSLARSERDGQMGVDARFDQAVLFAHNPELL